MSLNNFVFGAYPYIALTVFVLGSWMRFDREQYTWKSDSSQLLSKSQHALWPATCSTSASSPSSSAMPWVCSLRTPGSRRMGVSDMQHQYLAITAGAVFGGMGVIGGVMLWLRRMFNPRISATSRGTGQAHPELADDHPDARTVHHSGIHGTRRASATPA